MKKRGEYEKNTVTCFKWLGMVFGNDGKQTHLYRAFYSEPDRCENDLQHCFGHYGGNYFMRSDLSTHNFLKRKE